VKRLLIVLLLAGCVQQQRPAEPVPVKTTVYRYTSQSCESPDVSGLKAMTKSRNDWKRYAEKLEKLLPAKSANESHP
jgi:hypothetical protein